MSIFNSFFNPAKESEESKEKKVRTLMYLEILLGVCLILITVFVIAIASS
ncbi:MAG: hypothetical protein NXI20_16915 [bacterium]|nr:hypothetical protein [bacterium]